MGRKDLRIHDLRRSFGSWLGDAGFTSKQVGATLGHRSDITSRVYMQLGDVSKLAAVTAIDKLIVKSRQPKAKRGNNVISLNRRRRG
jgi:integrase